MSTSRCQQFGKFIAAVALSVLVLAAVAPQRSPGAQPAGRTVSLYFTVEEGNKLVSGLREENFRLYEDGESRSFRLVEPEKTSNIVLLVEYSQASRMYANDILRAMQEFLRAAPEGNWYALETFAQRPTIQVDFTKLPGKLLSAFDDLGSPLMSEINTYDAFHLALDRLGRIKGRNVVIFVGSGFDTFSANTLEDVQKDVESTNVVIFALGAGSMLRGEYNAYLGANPKLELSQAEAFLRMVANKTGGDAWFPRFEAAIPDVMRGAMQMLEYQYKIEYQSTIPADGEFHKIKLEAFRLEDDTRTDFKVRVREGWRRL